MPEAGSPEEELLTAGEVAARLAVTPSRVFQLVRANRLPAPIRKGGHRLWRADDVAVLLAARDGRVVSVPAVALSPVSEPLRQVWDRVVDYGSGPRSAGSRVHLRVWDGAGPEGRRVVVLIGALRDQPIRLEEAVAEVAARWLPARVAPSEVVWARLHHPVPVEPRPELESLLTTWPPIEPGLLGWLGDRFSTGDPTPPGVHLQPLTFPMLAAVLGAPVACIPLAVYTADTVGQVAAGPGDPARPVPVVHDQAGLALTCADLAALAAHTDPAGEPGLQRRRDATRAARELATALAARRALDAPSSDKPGDTDPEPPLGAWWATRSRALEASETQQTLLERYEHDPLPVDGDGARETTLLARLWEWADEVGEYAERPQPDLEAALRRAAAILETAVLAARRRRHGPRARPPRPPMERRAFRIAGDTDRSYLAALEPVEPAASSDPRLRRRGRALAAALLPVDRPRLQFGLDPAGHLVAHPAPAVAGRSAPGPGPDVVAGAGPAADGWFAVEWPLTPPQDPATGLVAAADGDPNGGERPVFLCWPDAAMTPLPSRSSGSLRPVWRFGGPHGTRALAEDLAELLADETTDGAAPAGETELEAGRGGAHDAGGAAEVGALSARQARWEAVCAALEVALAGPQHRRRLRLALEDYRPGPRRVG